MNDRPGDHMNSPLIFLDTETTGLSLDDDIWEIAAIRREIDGAEREFHFFVEHDPTKCAQLPPTFLEDHRKRFPGGDCTRDDGGVAMRGHAAEAFSIFVGDDRPHIVGAVPNFDTERLARLLERHGHRPGWHYHLIDVENLAVGYLAGEVHAEQVYGLNPRRSLPGLPWDSDDLSRAVGVEPPGEGVRHTAMGDVRWAMAVYDRVMGVSS